MSGIAKRYRVSQAMLAAANPRVNTRRLRINQRIVVPTGGALSTSVARRMADPVVAAGTNTGAFHRVRRGETLSEIADEYGVTQRELRLWNTLDSRGRIRAGQRLRIASPDAPRKVAPTAQPVESSGERTHVVRRGETLKSLAKRYGVSIQALREANGLSEQAPLKAGVALKIPG